MMPSVRNTVLAVAATIATVAQADYVIDPSTVPLSTRQAWCTSEKAACPLICQLVSDGTTKVNDCDPKTLTYGCICGDGKQPNVSEYSLTLPYFVCQEWGNQCVTACKGSNSCASSCREDHPCGAQSPNKTNATTTASTATGSATITASGTDSADVIYTNAVSSTASADSSKKGAAMALEVGSKWGMVMVMGSMFAGFALL